MHVQCQHINSSKIHNKTRREIGGNYFLPEEKHYKNIDNRILL